MNRNPERHTIMTDMEKDSVLTDLIIDLKKREWGRDYKAITMERLNEASKAIEKLQQCRKQQLFR
jgi:hypothetical protein